MKLMRFRMKFKNFNLKLVLTNLIHGRVKTL